MIAPDETTFEYMRGKAGVPEDFDAAVERGSSCRPTRVRPSTTRSRSTRARSPRWSPGARLPAWSFRSPTPSRIRPRWTPRPTARPPSGRSSTWVWKPARRWRTSVPSGSSSARAHQLPDLRPARSRGGDQGPQGGRHDPGDGRPGIGAGQDPGRGRAVSTRCSRRQGSSSRAPSCSMCLGMNPDTLIEGERCASTSNRNFEGRQGKGGRTHLVSPTMATAAAIEGHFVNMRPGAEERNEARRNHGSNQHHRRSRLGSRP